jgi:hypothetical protein
MVLEFLMAKSSSAVDLLSLLKIAFATGIPSGAWNHLRLFLDNGGGGVFTGNRPSGSGVSCLVTRQRVRQR